MKKISWLQRTVVGFGLTSFFNDFSHEMVTVLLPTIVSTLTKAGCAPLALGIISSVSNGTSLFMRLWAGYLSDRILYRKPWLILGYTITPLFSGLIGTAYSVWQVLLYRTIAWLGRGLREPLRDSWLASIVSPHDYGKVFGFNRALDTLGAIAGPLTLFFILPYFSLRALCLLSLIPGFFSVCALIVLIQEQTRETFAQPYVSFGHSIRQLPEQFIHFLKALVIFGSGNFNKTLIIFRAQELFTGTQAPLLATGLPILLYTLFNTIRALSEYIIGSLSDTSNRKNMLALFGFGLFGLASIALAFASTHVWVWILIFIVSGISTASVTTLEKAYTADLLPAYIRGTGYGVQQAVSGISELLSSTIVGLLWSFVSPTIGFFYAATTSFIATALLITTHPKK